MSGHRVSRAVAVSAFAALLACAQPAMAAQPATAEPFCDFLKRVLAAKHDGFAKLRGAASNSTQDYVGTLKVQPDADCGTGPADPWGRPYYNCSFNTYRTLAEGEPLYFDLAGQMRRCFPAAAFRERQIQPKADDRFPRKGRTLRGISEGYNIELALDNNLSALTRMVEELNGGRAKSPTTYNINIDVRAAR